MRIAAEANANCDHADSARTRKDTFAVGAAPPSDAAAAAAIPLVNELETFGEHFVRHAWVSDARGEARRS